MKRKLLLSCLFLAGTLFAKTELSVNIGTNSFDNDENLKSATTLGVRGDFYLDDIYHIDFGYDYLGDNYSKDVTILAPVKIHRFYSQFSADGEEEYHVVPSLSLGVGYEYQDGYNENSHPFLSLGIGFRYNISNSFNFLLGTKALCKMTSKDINYHTTFGVGYLIDEAPANNEDVSGEEIVIPKEKLEVKEVKKVVIPEQKIFHPQPVDTKVQSITVSKEVLKPSTHKEKPAKKIVTQVIKTKQKKTNTIELAHADFIQVGAFTTYRPTKLLDKLTNSGYHIILRHQGKITKALVGPYHSKAETKRALTNVRKIAPKAFIYKVN